MATSTLHKGWLYKHEAGVLAAVSPAVAFAGAVAHGANTALDGVLLGTPVTPALAVDSVVISNRTANGDILIAANNGGNSQAWLNVDSSAGTLTLYGAGTAMIVISSTVFEIEDDKILALGTDSDQAFVNRSTVLNAATALTGVVVGTPVTEAIPANSLIASNVTADGDQVFMGQTGGHSQEWLRYDASVKLVVINEASGDVDTRVETNGMAYAIYADGALNALVLGSNTDTSSADQLITVSRAARTATATVNYYDLAIQPAGAVTVPAGVTAVVASLQVAEPNITATGTVTNAASIYVPSQPTEGATNAGIGLADNVFLALGTNSDQVLVHNSAGLAATTALTGVILGTPVTPTIAANSLIISNTTASGDILLAANLATNSQAWLWVDSSASLMKLYAAGVEAVNFGVGATTFNLGMVDIDFKIRASNADVAFLVDAGLASITIGGGALAGTLLNLNGDFQNRAYATSVGFVLNMVAVTLTSSNANPTTLAIGAAVALGTQTYAGANAGQTISDAVTLYIANPPQQGANMTLTRAWALWVDGGNARFDGDVNMAATASDIVIIAATAAALEISDATTKFYAFDTRIAVAGVTTHALDVADYTIASAAGNVVTGLALAAHTLNYSGTTQVTTEAVTVSLGARSIVGDTATLTVDKASTLKLVAPIEGANITLTAAVALRIGDSGAGTPTNQYGIFIETLTAGATADYAIWVAGANAVHLGTAGTATGLLEIDGATSGTMTLTVPAGTTSYTLTLPPAANTNAGYQLTCAGADTITTWAGAASVREVKDIMGEHNAKDALNKMLGAKVYDFHYKKGKGTQDSKTKYVGVMADEAPWAMHHDGGVVNPVNALGYTVLGFQAMAAKIKSLEDKLAALGA